MRGGNLTLNEAEVWSGARPDPSRNLRVHGGQARLIVMSQDGEIVRKTGRPGIRVAEGKAPSLPPPPSRCRRANNARRPRLEGATNQSTSLGWPPADVVDQTATIGTYSALW